MGAKRTLDYDKVFNQVLIEVKKGSTIEEACKNLGIIRRSLYRILTPIQKKELVYEKALKSDFNHISNNKEYKSMNDLFKNKSN